MAKKRTTSYTPIIETNIDEYLEEVKKLKELIDNLKKKKIVISMGGYSPDKS